MIDSDLDAAVAEISSAERILVDRKPEEINRVFLCLARAKRFVKRAKAEADGKNYEGGLYPQASLPA